MKKELGVVLSGGGAKGVAHVAFLERIKVFDVGITMIAGSSAGALVGALYAAGNPPEKIVQFFRKTPLFKMAWIETSRPGFFNSDKYMNVVRNYVPDTFEELQIPLVIAAVNLEESRVEYFSTGDLLRPLLASCAVPFLFSPVIINGQWFGDGSIIDNFPVWPLKKKKIPCIGSYVCKPSLRQKKELNSAIKVSNHAHALLLHAANVSKIDETLFTIQFELDDFYSFSNRHIDQIYQRAKEVVQREINEVVLFKA